MSSPILESLTVEEKQNAAVRDAISSHSDNLMGQVLTLIEIAMPESSQLSALKQQIKTAFYRMMGEIYRDYPISEPKVG